MAFLGFVSERQCRGWQDASVYLPAFSFYEKHQSEPIDAAPEAIIQAVLSLDMAEDPIIRRLLMLRQLPGTVRQRLFKTELTTPPAMKSRWGWPGVFGGLCWASINWQLQRIFTNLTTRKSQNWCCVLRLSRRLPGSLCCVPKPLSGARHRRLKRGLPAIGR